MERDRLTAPLPTPDPQEVDDEVRLPMPGEAYPGEGGAPEVAETTLSDDSARSRSSRGTTRPAT